MKETSQAEFETNLRKMEAYEARFARYHRVRKAFFRKHFRLYHRMEVIGRENIPEGAALIAANHSGGLDLDIVALSYGCVPEREIQVLIVDNWHYLNSNWGRYYVGGGIPLWARGGIRYEYIDPYLKRGGKRYPNLVAIFPEGNSGTFRYRRVLRRFFTGVVRIALRYQVPIVPVAMVGFQNACPIFMEIERDHAPADPICPFLPFPAKLKVEFGPPFTLEKFSRRPLTRAEENWIANHFVRPKVAELLQKHHPTVMQSVDLEMKEPT